MPFFRRKQPQGVPVDLSSGDARAARLLEAVRTDHVEGVRDTLAEVSDAAERERLTHLLTDVPGHEKLFDAWVEIDPDSHLARLSRGAYWVGHAWEARGAAFSEYVEEDAWEVFFDRLRVAEDDLHQAAEMDPTDPVPWSHLLTSGRGLQVPKEELWIRYEEAQRRQPWLVETHMQLLQSLCAKWYGSDEESVDFAHTTDREAPPGAAARAVVPMAYIEVWLAMNSRDDQDHDAYRGSSGVRKEIQEAADRSVFADGFSDDLPSVYALNVFAMGFYLFGDEDNAKRIVQRLGTRRTDFPWAYFNDPDAVYGGLLEA